MDINTCFATTEAYRSLALYSHLIPAIAAFVLGFFAYVRAPSRLKAAFFFCFSLAFAAWLLGDVVVWTANSYHLVAALWAPLDLLEITFFLLLFGFVYVDLFPKKLPQWFNPALLIAAGIPFILTVLGKSVYELNQPVCEMLNNRFLEDYKLLLEIVVLSGTLILGLMRIVAVHGDRTERIRIALVTLSVFLFMGIFGGSEYYANTTYVYEVHLYALFTLPIFILLLTIAITSYSTFRLGDAAVKTLFYVFLVLAGTQFFFVQDMTGFLLAAMSFGVVLTLGVMLFRLSEREIAQRHLIEKQEQELEVVNKQQENLLHFISHEIKGYLTKSEAGFASIVEGDYGTISEQLTGMAKGALADVRKGVRMVMEILDASNLKKGTVGYKMQSFDLRAAVVDTVEHLKPTAEQKHIGIKTTIDTKGDFVLNGDEEKIRQHVLRNLIDNAIRYTPSGNIEVTLTDGDKLRFSVKDSGVGITPEDMKLLFTEGGHGKDSMKVNVHSTGYGLFIAKQIVEAHKGKIWAESEGTGKGSRFVIELPAA
ncbi:MAG: HAMP domain-containing sensor histidine kinase [Patescibacteria group bacterium]